MSSDILFFETITDVIDGHTVVFRYTAKQNLKGLSIEWKILAICR